MTAKLLAEPTTEKHIAHIQDQVEVTIAQFMEAMQIFYQPENHNVLTSQLRQICLQVS